MNNSLKTQLDIKNNAEDLQNFLLDMKTWEKEIKEKEKKLTGVPAVQENVPLPRHVAKKRQTEVTKPAKEKKRISAYDYRAWDKFDVDKACKEIDGASESCSRSESGSDSEHDLPGVVKKLSESAPKETDKSSTIETEKSSIDKVEEKNKDNDVLHNLGNDTSKETRQDKEDKFNNIDLAYFEKELGNKFVREEKWQEAIECYSKSIKLDPSNPIYYANRALCHIKLTNFKVAEVDSTIALQLDKSYAKAYQRRAFARKALQQYREAKADYEQLLLLEPKNVSAQVEISKINEFLTKSAQKVAGKDTKLSFNPKNMFNAKQSNKTAASNEKNAKPVLPQEKILIGADIKGGPGNQLKDTVLVSSVFSSLPPNFIPVTPITKSPHLRSKKSLKKIGIKQVEGSLSLDRLISTLPLTASKPSGTQVLQEKVPLSSTVTNVTEESESNEVPCIPKTCVQFELSWRIVSKNEKLSYVFLKSIPCRDLPAIFGSSLESWLLSELIRTIAGDISLEDPEFLYEFLRNLANVERFKSLLLFMSSQDQKGLERCCLRLEERFGSEKIDQLRHCFDLI